MKQLLLSCCTFLVLLVFAGCSKTTFPAITSSPTNTYRYGDVVWRDLVTIRPDASAKFYSDVFGWQFEKVLDGKIDYYTIRNSGTMIGGMVHYDGRTEDKGSEWVSYVSVESVTSTVNSVKNNGGKVYGEEYAVPGRGEVAMITDPSNAFMGLIHAEGGDPAALPLTNGNWVWTELWSDAPMQVIPFYEKFGLQFEKDVKSGIDYYLMRSDGQTVASMIANPVENWRSLWVPYVLVDDVDAIVRRVSRSEGKVVFEPTEEVRNGNVAVVMDPGGALVIVQQKG